MTPESRAEKIVMLDWGCGCFRTTGSKELKEQITNEIREAEREAFNAAKEQATEIADEHNDCMCENCHKQNC